MTVDIASLDDPSRIAGVGARTYIRKVVLSNFKRFAALALDFDRDLNVFAGDNEVGKSTILLAIDLALAASRSKVENLGIETLVRKSAIQTFLSGTKNPADLPTLFVEVYLSNGGDPDLYGRCNSLHETAFGLRFSCEPSDDYSQEIKQVLAEEVDNFPFEFYSIKFSTFAGTFEDVRI